MELVVRCSNLEKAWLLSINNLMGLKGEVSANWKNAVTVPITIEM